MRVPMAWLREHVDVAASAEEVARRLTVSCSSCTVERSSGGGDVLVLRPPFERPDLMSVRGVAREVAAAVEGAQLAEPPAAAPPADAEPVPVVLRDPAVRRIVAVRLRGADALTTPSALRRRLAAAGVVPRSPSDAIAAWALFEAGLPVHVLPLAGWGPVELVARRAEKGEQLATADGRTLALEVGDLVLAAGGTVAALAGIDDAAAPSAADVLLVVGSFDPVAVARTAERLRARTELSVRAARGTNPREAAAAGAAALRLAEELGARCTGWGDAHEPLPDRRRLACSAARVEALAGFPVPEERRQAILAALGYELAGDGVVVVPDWREGDVSHEGDVAADVVRVEIERCVGRRPRPPARAARLDTRQRLQRRAEDVLAGCGLFEVYTPSIVEAGPGRDGPQLAAGRRRRGALRTNLLSGLVDCARENLRRHAEPIRIFEVGRVFRAANGVVPREAQHVAGLLQGDFLVAKGVVEMLYQRLRVPLALEAAESELLAAGRAAATAAGCVGELDPALLPGPWAAFELDLAALARDVGPPPDFARAELLAQPRPHVAFVVPATVQSTDLVTVAREAAGGDVIDVAVVDVFGPRGLRHAEKSVTLAVAFARPTDRPSADAVLDRIATALAASHGARRRTREAPPTAG